MSEGGGDGFSLKTRTKAMPYLAPSSRAALTHKLEKNVVNHVGLLCPLRVEWYFWVCMHFTARQPARQTDADGPFKSHRVAGCKK